MVPHHAGRPGDLAADERLRLVFAGLDTVVEAWLDGGRSPPTRTCSPRRPRRDRRAGRPRRPRPAAPLRAPARRPDGAARRRRPGSSGCGAAVFAQLGGEGTGRGRPRAAVCRRCSRWPPVAARRRSPGAGTSGRGCRRSGSGSRSRWSASGGRWSATTTSAPSRSPTARRGRAARRGRRRRRGAGPDGARHPDRAPGRVVTAALPVEDGVARARVVVEDAELWWTHDLGTPALHDVRVELARGRRGARRPDRPRRPADGGAGPLPRPRGRPAVPLRPQRRPAVRPRRLLDPGRHAGRLGDGRAVPRPRRAGPRREHDDAADLGRRGLRARRLLRRDRRARRARLARLHVRLHRLPQRRRRTCSARWRPRPSTRSGGCATGPAWRCGAATTRCS